MSAQPQKNYYPIVIVGGGLVGATLAIALKQVGVESLVVEAFAQDSKQQPSFDDRSVALSLSSLKILESLGFENKIYANSQPIKNIHVSDQGHYGFSRLYADKLAVPQLGAVIENKVLGRLLLETIKEENIEYCCPARVISAKNLEVNGQTEIELEGLLEKVNCQLLILAEGSRSELKKQLGFQSQVTDYQASGLVCNIKTQLPHKDWAFERFTQHGPLALLPLSGQRLSIVWSNNHDRTKQLLEVTDKDFAKELETVFGSRLGRIEQVGTRLSFPLVQEVSSNSIRKGCLLMGNSAQSLHPIAGQGLNLAIRDIKALKEFITSSEQQLSLMDYQWLEQYQQSRKSDKEETIAITETLARLFSNSWAPLSITRNLMMKLMDITPAAKEAFAHKAMGFRA